ncbi:thioesterase [Aldersonia sp. NBC_00410]|uniref:acyl-[acyl-carrier-protein] thioesterase n=1 Tax=Aldersonia sp. NBC_00410 TaxID=2975954 RepID=UPI00225B9A70|nr:acyl-ACP thioesterase domain-containing protein [Aldersonia sp. NBC_00410]MCX5041618.1 thioesterase [Aldersonia sp. NBC_00410]
MATTVDEPLTPPPGPNVGFTSSWPVRAADIDPDTRVRLDGIARYLEDIAWENLQASMLPGTDPIWIVRRTVIDAVRPINWPDRVHLRRWCAGLSTRWTAMRVRMESSRGGLIESEGFWINISESTGMPTRISDEGLAYLQTMTDEHRLKWRRWLGEDAPPESGADLHFPLRATDIDQFNHVNNAAYWQAVEQYLVDYPSLVAQPFRAVIEYNAPIFAGEDVMVRGRLDPGVDDTESDQAQPALRLWFMVGESVRTAVSIGPMPEAAGPGGDSPS